jgi:2-methylfumaryl-CoA isomerase
VHRGPIGALVAAAIAERPLAELGPLFDASGVTWSVYRTLGEALVTEPRLFGENPIFSTIDHAGGSTYLTPGAAARLSGDELGPPAPSPRIGEHSDEVLAGLLGLTSREIGQLHDQGLVA